MGQIVSKRFPRALLHASSSIVSTVIAKRASRNTHSCCRISEGAIGAAEDTSSSYIITIVIRIAGTNWYALLGIVIGISVWLCWADRHTNPCGVVSEGLIGC